MDGDVILLPLNMVSAVLFNNEELIVRLFSFNTGFFLFFFPYLNLFSSLNNAFIGRNFLVTVYFILFLFNYLIIFSCLEFLNDIIK